MKLQQLIQAAQFKISEGSEYQWKCFGNNARFLDFENIDNGAEVSLVFDTKTQEVYQANFILQDTLILWTNPDFDSVFKEECKTRKVSPTKAYDKVHYKEINNFAELISFIEKGFK